MSHLHIAEFIHRILKCNFGNWNLRKPTGTKEIKEIIRLPYEIIVSDAFKV